jgi:hypothetical protein
MKRAGLVVFAFGLLVRIALIHWHPIIFGGDTVLRLANRDHILLSYQLPALQAVVHFASMLGDGLLAVRYALALIGAAAGMAFYRLMRAWLGPWQAAGAALLFTTHPFLLQLSIVPYQEILMLAALLFAFDFFFREKTAAASLCLGLACLTRYEAWAACPVLAVMYLQRAGWRPRQLAAAGLMFGWAPLAWMAFHAGISMPGSFVLEVPRSARRLVRYVYLGWITVKTTPAPVLLLALVGLTTLPWKDPRVRALAAFLLLFLLSIPFSAHGEAPDPERFVTSRESTLWITAVVFAAGLAMAARSRWTPVLAGAGVVFGVVMAHQFLVRDTGTPKVALSYKLAQYLDRNMAPDERALLLTAPIPDELVQDYLEKVTPARARRLMSAMNTSPPDYQRTLIHTRRRLVSLASIPIVGLPPPADVPVTWVALWSDFRPSNPLERHYAEFVAGRQPAAVLTEGPFSVRIFRLTYGTVNARMFDPAATAIYCLPASM